MQEFILKTTPENMQDTISQIQLSNPSKMIPLMGELHNVLSLIYKEKDKEKSETHEWVKMVFSCIDNRIVRKHDERYGRLIPFFALEGDEMWDRMPKDAVTMLLEIYLNPLINVVIKSRISDLFWERYESFAKHEIASFPKKVAIGRENVLQHVQAAIAVQKYVFDDPKMKAMISSGHWEKAIDTGNKIRFLVPIESNINELLSQVEIAIKEKNIWVITYIEIELLLRGRKNDPATQNLITNVRLNQLLDVCEQLPNEDFIKEQVHLPQDVIDCKEKILRLLGRDYDYKTKCLEKARAIEQYAERQSDPIIRIFFLHQAIPMYQQAGEKEQANTLIANVRLENAKAIESDSFKTATGQIQFSTQQIEEMCEEITQGSRELCVAMRNIASRVLIPSLENGDYFTNQYESESVMMQFATIMPIVGDRSMKPMAAGSDEAKTFEKNRKLHLDLELTSSFIVYLFKYLTDNLGFKTDEAIKCLEKAYNYEDEDSVFLKPIFECYFENNHVISLHLLVPHVERLIRRYLTCRGVSITSIIQGSLKNKPLGELIREAENDGAFSREVAKLLEAALSTESYGWNLRNKIAHGDISFHEFTPHRTARLLHIMLILYYMQ